MVVTPLFRDRVEAGQILARRLKSVVVDSHALVLWLPRGDLPVGFEIAQTLDADLDVFLVRKLGVPGQEEMAMVAIASGGVRVLNRPIIQYLGVSLNLIDRVTSRERNEIESRERSYRQGRPALPIANRTAILVDDGLATGATMLAAARAVRAKKPKRIICSGTRRFASQHRRGRSAGGCLGGPAADPCGELSIVPGATHLFEEPGTLEQVAKLACNWFEGHLKSPGGV